MSWNDFKIVSKLIELRKEYRKDVKCWTKISEHLNIPQEECMNFYNEILKWSVSKDILSEEQLQVIHDHKEDIRYDYCLHNFSQLCRLCCSTSDSLEVVYSKDANDASGLIYKIQNIFHNNNSYDDYKLVNLVCQNCTDKVNSFYKFKTLCDENFRMLLLVKSDLDTIESQNTEFVQNEEVQNVIIDEFETENVDTIEEYLRIEDVDALVGYQISAEPPLDTQKFSKSKEKSNTGVDTISNKKTYKGKPSQCQICGKIVKGLQMHLLIHANLKKHHCQYCNKSFTQSGQLKRHINSHLNIRNYQCPKCDRTFVDPSSVSKHLVVHNKEERNFQCSLCGSRFNRLGALRYHEKTHRNERDHVCSVCAKSFLAKYDLTKHLRTHTGEKPYSCPYCDKKFSISKNAQVHLRAVHSKMRPYKCQECSLNFAYRSSLKNHLIKIHNHADVSNSALFKKTNTVQEDDLQSPIKGANTINLETTSSRTENTELKI